MSNEIIKKDGVLPKGFNPFPKIDLVSPSSDPTTQKGFLNLKSMNPMEIATGILDGIAGNRSSKMNPTSAAISTAFKGALNFVPGGSLLNKIDSGLPAANELLGINPLSGLSTGDKLLSSVPILKEVSSWFGTKLEKKNFDQSSVASDFSFTKENKAAELGGKSVLFGKDKFKNQINSAWRTYNTKANITDYNKKRLDNDISTQLQNRTMDIMSGEGQKYRLVKSGGKLYKTSEWTSFLEILKEISSKRGTENAVKDLQKFQLGGKMNLIPEGSLHARKHNIVSSDPELKGQITTKGIPVISKSDGGIVQHAEIEKEEWTLRKEFTDKLESLYKQYLENPSEDIAIEAGKLICYELLQNTDDRSGLIKSTK